MNCEAKRLTVLIFHTLFSDSGRQVERAANERTFMSSQWYK